MTHHNPFLLYFVSRLLTLKYQKILSMEIHLFAAFLLAGTKVSSSSIARTARMLLRNGTFAINTFMMDRMRNVVPKQWLHQSKEVKFSLTFHLEVNLSPMFHLSLVRILPNCPHRRPTQNSRAAERRDQQARLLTIGEKSNYGPICEPSLQEWTLQEKMHGNGSWPIAQKSPPAMKWTHGSCK